MCGMDTVKEAILIALVNPHSGGLLISGGQGTGKSTLLRSARELVDDPWVEVPISITEDRLFGAVDTEEAIKSGKRILLPGLIDEADGGLLYIDDVNVLRDDLLSAILNIQEAGGYRLERDGLSSGRDTRFTVVAVMNPGSGTLSSSSLDRFGLFVQADSEENEENRAEIIRRVLAFEKDSTAYRANWEHEIKELRCKIQAARKQLSVVDVSAAMIQLAAVYTLKAHVAGHRADIYLIEAARALAALHGRAFVLPKDLERAAEFVLPHRMRRADQAEEPQPKEGEENESQENSTEDHPSEQNHQPPDPSDGNDEPESSPQSPPEDTTSQIDTEDSEGNDERKENAPPMTNPGGVSQEKIEAANLNVKLPPVWIEPPDDRKRRKGSGKRGLTRTDLMQGRYVRAEQPKGKTEDIAFDATLRAAAPYQRIRPKNDCAVRIRKEDIRSKVREKRTGSIFLFVVDASGSMGARERMKTVKGVILRILTEAYQKRDKVGMIAFRKNKAEVILPVTRSVDFAQKKLATMPTGGKTPLAAGLAKAEDVLDLLYRQDNTQDPVMILITDGRATASLEKGGNATEDAMTEARRLSRRNLPVAVIDTESGFIKLGLAKKLAGEMKATYFQMDHMSEDTLLRIGRSTRAKA